MGSSRADLILKDTVMQIEKAPINDRLRVSKVSWKVCILNIYNFIVIREIWYFLKSSLLNSFYCL